MRKSDQAVARIGTVVALQPKSEGRRVPSKVCICGNRHTTCDREDGCKEVRADTPIAQALIGKKVGDTVTVRTPGGTYQVQILDIVPDEHCNAA